MADLLLQTKLVIPVTHGLITRHRLTQKLEEGRRAGKSLALISSSAGSGKTSLLIEWGSHSQSAFAWFSIDDGDNEPARFWIYLISALQRTLPGVGQAAAQLLASSPSVPAQTVLTSLINELIVRPEPLVLVLDDYHTISNPDIHNGITFLSEHLPAHVGLAISTRADPPLPVFRLRAHNLLTEIREADLRFTTQEAQQFFKEGMGLDLSVDEIKALENRTEGWIAGLQLAALALQSSPPSGRLELIEHFGGSHEFILEYLVEEVLAHQSRAVQDFLIRTAILDRLCAALCDAVLLSESGSQTILEYLEHSNLFTFSLDSEHHWFRYHRLFADLLASRLNSMIPEAEIIALHTRAGGWLAQNGFTDEAVKHAFALRDYEMAADFIEPSARQMIFSGQVNQLKGWLDSLPDLVLKAHLQLNIFRAWIKYIQGECELLEGNLKETDQLVSNLPPTPENERIKVEYAVMMCRFVALAGNSARAIAMADEALRHLPEPDLASRARVYSALAIAYGTQGQFEQAEAAYRKCFEMAKAAGYYSLLAHTTMIKAAGQSSYGKLRGPASDLQAVLDLVAKTGQRAFFPSGQAYIGLASIYLEWNDLQTAQEYLEKGMELCRQGGLDGVFYGLVFRSRLRQAHHDLMGAVEDLRQAEEIVKRKDYMTIARLVQLAIASRDSAKLEKIAAELRPIFLPGGPSIPLLFAEVLKVSLVRILLAQGNFAAALQWMDEIESTAEAGGRFGRLIEVHLLRALALQRQNYGKMTPDALRNIRISLELAEPEGYVRLYLEEGPEVAALLKAAAGEAAWPGPLKQYVFRLLDALAAEGIRPPDKLESGPGSIPDQASLVEPLSKREVDILKLICEGLSNQEIADRLVITLYTVKKHSSNIFGKLGVSSRTQAAVRARHLGLVD